MTGHGLDRPFQELLDGIAPPPPFPVPTGFPLPWEVATAYRLMITLYKLNFNGSWELQKPRKPDFVIVPPLSDFTNLFQPPDFSGVDCDNPVEDVCDVFVALIEWIVKEIAAVIKLIGDLIKMVLSPLTYPIRLGAVRARDEDLGRRHEDPRRPGAHRRCCMPHAEQRYADNGELRLPNEIDLPLITLGGTVDAPSGRRWPTRSTPSATLDTDQSASSSVTRSATELSLLPGDCSSTPTARLRDRRLGVPPALGLPADQ